ncbi:MAG: FAD-dependent oxidoreductase [Bdellovibrionia bacterium]
MHQYLTLSFLQENFQKLTNLINNHPLQVGAVFALIYVVTTAASIPGAAILTLAAGAFFGFGFGTLIASIASSVGATLAFIGARYLFREFAERKFNQKLEAVNVGLQKDGSYYLLTLRLVPVFPFFLVNILMGLTKFPIWKYFFISQLGMLPGTMVYVYAGTQLSQIKSMQEIYSTKLLLAFTLLGLMPLLTQKIISWFQQRKHIRKFKKPHSFDYNMVVIGGGSAGLVSAYIASAVKAKVALIEKHKMGGDCLNTGCVPSKALIRSAKISRYIQRGKEFGIEASSIQTDFPRVMDRIKKVIQEIEPHDSIERYTNLGVECWQGEAKILSPYEVQVGSKILTTKNIVIATGARPLVPALPGIELVTPLTSENVWSLQVLPQNLVILGGGPIGCELAQAFSRLGSKVTLVEMSDRILAKEDLEVSTLIKEVFEKDGIKALTSHKALRFEEKQNSKKLICKHMDQEISITFDQVFFALGRKANTTGFGLEELQVEVSASGNLVADKFLRTTNYPNIYVCGDVTGPYQFTHTASHQAWYVAVNALFSPLKSFAVEYRVIPWCTFTDPEVARVGLNELEAREKNIAYEVSQYEINDLDRAIADGEAHGFVKVLTKPGTDKILGVTIVGHHAGDIIAEYVTAMKFNLGLNKILSTIHIYPTLSEANKFAAGVWKRKNAPAWALNMLGKYHQWRRSL